VEVKRDDEPHRPPHRHLHVRDRHARGDLEHRRSVTGHHGEKGLEQIIRRAHPPLPNGGQLKTLRDAGNYIAKLPKREHSSEEWQIFECLPESTIPDELIGAGHDLREEGEGQRILAHAVTQRLTLSSCGIFEEMTEGSTQPIAETRTHAGLCKVLRFTFLL
jgi:hypothetical protein